MTDPRPPAGHRWPVFIVLLALFFLGLSTWSIYRAGRDVSPPLAERPAGYPLPRPAARD